MSGIPNAADPADIAAHDEVAKLATQYADRDLASILATKEGRRFLGGLIYGFCGVNRRALEQSFEATAYAEGCRAVGIRLLDHIERIDFAATLTIQAEMREERERAAIVASQVREAVAKSLPPPGTAAGQPLDDVS